MTKTFACWCALLSLAAAGTARAQSPKRLPIIAGNGLVHVLVEVDGTVKTWGDPAAMDPSPSLGDGVKPSATREVKSPRPLPGVGDVVGATVAVTHILLLKRDGTVLAWGENDSCELGTGDDKTRLAPVPVPGLRGVTEVAAAAGVSGAVLSDGTVRMCGSNADAALGDFSGVKEHLTPFQVPGVTGVRSARSDGSTTIVQLNDGTLRGWGNGYYGSLGDGHGDRTTARPAAPIGVGPVLAHYTSGSGSYAIRADGTVMVWGIPAAPGGKTDFVLTPIPGFKVALDPVAK